MKNFVENYGKWAFVTGASSGIGAEFAQKLAGLGMNLVLAARRRERLLQRATTLEKEFPIKVRCLSVDLSTEDFMARILSETSDMEIGLLINNAGFANTGEFVANDRAREAELLHVNCRAPMLLSHAFGQEMKKRKKGGIIFVSSIAAFSAMPLWSHYAATKAYCLLLGEGIAHEFKQYGVDVLTVCPGATRSEFQTIAGVETPKAMAPGKVVSSAISSLGKKTVVIPGWQNGLMASSNRFLPRWLNTQRGHFIVNHIQKKCEIP